MRVLFLHYGPFDCNSAVQTFHFANRLVALGFEVCVCATGNAERVESVGEPSFECLEYADLPAKVADYARHPRETIVHAWTPREGVRRATAYAVNRLGAPYVVHLEDNEDHLLATLVGRDVEEIRSAPLQEQDAAIEGDLFEYAHPSRYPEFLRAATGITVITEELNEFNFAGRPHHLMRPGVDAGRFAPDLKPPLARQELGIGPDEFMLVYHGAMHHANEREMFSLYVAVNLLQRRGNPVRLLRLGDSMSYGIDDSFAALRDRGAVELGTIPWREVPGYLAIADAFVQPGAPDEFNRYRLPSKLPEFLAMGRAVVLPHCNIGAELSDGVNALLLEEGRGVEIADRVERLIDDPRLAERLGREAREFALRNLDWDQNTVRLAEFYRQIARSARNGDGRSRPSHRMRSFRHPRIQRLREVVRARTRLRAARARVGGAIGAGDGAHAGSRGAPSPVGVGTRADRTLALLGDQELWRVSERYRGRFAVPPLSYATVADYADSLEGLGGLARASFDMKNVQRGWALKAVLGNVEPGMRLVEIGAGEPLVAGILSRIGYDVTVVDPYDGSGNGPREHDAYRRAYPELTFIRDTYPPREPIEGPVGAVYSISVLEHVSAAAVGEVVATARELVGPSGGCCIHAVDHVLRGWGAEEHREGLGEIVSAAGLSAALLDDALRRLEDDPEAYFVSAEAHNEWRGGLPYDEYPMRRIASINLFARA